MNFREKSSLVVCLCGSLILALGVVNYLLKGLPPLTPLFAPGGENKALEHKIEFPSPLVSFLSVVRKSSSVSGVLEHFPLLRGMLVPTTQHTDHPRHHAHAHHTYPGVRTRGHTNWPNETSASTGICPDTSLTLNLPPELASRCPVRDLGQGGTPE